MSVKNDCPPEGYCPFTPGQIRGKDCRWGRLCDWYVYEGDRKAYCAVGTEPELHLAHQVGARLRANT